MTYEDAMQSNVSVLSALRELRNHGFNACVSGDVIMAGDDIGPAETIANVVSGMVSARAILDWLGY